MFIAIVSMSIKAIKLDDITVTFQPRIPNNPIIIIKDNKQEETGLPGLIDKLNGKVLNNMREN